MLAESSSVLHSGCVQAEWDAPTVVGGAGARARRIVRHSRCDALIDRAYRNGLLLSCG